MIVNYDPKSFIVLATDVLTRVTIEKYAARLVRNYNCTNFAQNILNRLQNVLTRLTNYDILTLCVNLRDCLLIIYCMFVDKSMNSC